MQDKIKKSLHNNEYNNNYIGSMDSLRLIANDDLMTLIGTTKRYGRVRQILEILIARKLICAY